MDEKNFNLELINGLVAELKNFQEVIRGVQENIGTLIDAYNRLNVRLSEIERITNA